MPWFNLTFGRHAGKTLPQVLFCDPDWFFWAMAEGIFTEKVVYEDDANDIYRKATSIRIPGLPGQERVAEYAVDPSSGTFAGLEFVPANRPRHEGSTHTFRRVVIDMSVPHRYMTYDKRGNQMLIQTLKLHLFGDRHCRLTKQRCEAFLEDDQNFIL